jgi:hypothetical protein
MADGVVVNDVFASPSGTTDRLRPVCALGAAWVNAADAAAQAGTVLRASLAPDLHNHVVGRRIVDEGSGSCHGGEADAFSSRRCSTVEQTQHLTSAPQECPDCQAPAADLEAHKQWHSRLVHDIATAVDTDVRRRGGQ